MSADRTWRSKSGLLMFHLDMPTGGRPSESIIRASRVFLDKVGAIGSATIMEVSTHAGGENAFTWTDLANGVAIADRLAAHAELWRVSVSSDLRIETMDHGELVLYRAMRFWAQTIEDDSPPDAPIELTLVLDTDIYLARTWGDERDNRALASLNAPRFNRFFMSFLSETGAQVDSISDDDYHGQLDETGVCLAEP